MLGLLPISTLFPYTTLFRSRLEVADLGRLAVPGLLAGAHDDVRAPQGDERGRRRGRLRDRKSTRLNSSHVENSYAVFCLKKKLANLEDDRPDAIAAVRLNLR